MKSPRALALSLLAPAMGGVLESRANADPAAPTVIVLRGPTTDEVTSEAAARVEGELTAAGFHVRILPVSDADTESDLESAGHEWSPVAAFAIFARRSDLRARPVAEIWVTDRLRQKTVIQRAQLDESDRNRESEILAVRAVELLKASLAELWLPATAPAPSASGTLLAATPLRETARSDEHPVAPTPRAAFASGWGVGLGASVEESFGAIEELWAPTALLSYGTSRGLGARVTFRGLGPSLTLNAAAGTARIDQQLVTLEVIEAFWPTAAVVPFVCAGAGAQHVQVDGNGIAPYRGHSSDGWSLVTSVCTGVGVPLFRQLSFIVQTKGTLAWPPTAVQIASAEVGRLGGPALLFDAGLLGVFR
jgi:hypothetical protein